MILLFKKGKDDFEGKAGVWRLELQQQRHTVDPGVQKKGLHTQRAVYRAAKNCVFFGLKT